MGRKGGKEERRDRKIEEKEGRRDMRKKREMGNRR